MIASGICAFIIPPSYLQNRLPGIDLFFAPVSAPAGAVAGWARGKIAPELSIDQRNAEAVKRENEELRNELATLSFRLSEIQKLEEYANEIGSIRPYCSMFNVAGSDAGPRATLSIRGSSLQGLRDGMFVLYPNGIVGTVQRAGVAGVRVKLITDAGSRLRCSFVRYSNGKFIRLSTPDSLAEGTGRGAMKISLLTLEEVNNTRLAVGDYTILNEPDWPNYLQGWILGKVTAAGPRPDKPLFALITVEPLKNLLRLDKVLILTREPAKAE